MSSLSLSDRIERIPEVAGEAVPGDYLVLDLRDGRYFEMGPVGGLVWQRLEFTDSLQEIAATLVRVFSLDTEVAARDLLEFVEQLLAAGLARRLSAPDR